MVANAGVGEGRLPLQGSVIGVQWWLLYATKGLCGVACVGWALDFEVAGWPSSDDLPRHLPRLPRDLPRENEIDTLGHT